MKFVARKGAHLRKEDVQKVGQRLYELGQEKGGELEPIDVVKDAQPRTSVMHKYFTWEDSEAAQKYREQQARMLIGAVVEVKIIKGDKREVRSFYNVKNSCGKSVYVTVEDCLETKDYMIQIVEETQGVIKSLNTTLDLFIERLKRSK